MKLLFGGLISLMLLGLYVHLVYRGIEVARCPSLPGCTHYTPASFTPGMAQALSIVGGLVSALVIAELAVTAHGRAPLTRILDHRNAANWAVRTTAIVATCYVLVWIVAGFSAFITGLYHPEGLPALTAHGQGWLGLSVSAAYAYFGLSPANSDT
ncbi:MAG TPA: hypothetical protein VGD21_08060 [Lysobacter sp.]